MTETDNYDYRPSAWVQSQVHDLRERLAEGRTRPCPHLSDPEGEWYAYALWAPQLIRCVECLAPALAAPPGLCDHCGMALASQQLDYAPTPEGAEWILYFRMCEDCKHSEMG